jgi:hypothetical protein
MAVPALGMMAGWWPQPRHQIELLDCQGQFAEFHNGFPVRLPSEVRFIVDWLTPWVQTDSGRTGRITALTSAVLTFEVPYDNYKMIYHVNRVDGTIIQNSSLGGRFTGDCVAKPYETQF